jgi:CRISPR-associated protein Cmr4
MTPTFYTITAKTNLHVGSGDANYGIIDKLVQRDVLTQLPTINASSLKGAILQHFFKQDKEVVSDTYIDIVFGGQSSGSKRRDKIGRSESKTGEFVFMQANLLSLPVRCSHHTFMRVSSSQILLELSQQFASSDQSKISELLLKIADKASTHPRVLDEKYSKEKFKLEDMEFTASLCKSEQAEFAKIKSLLGDDRLVILPEKEFNTLSGNHYLPVIARNHLENGKSSNLWYEQVLPRETRFFCSIIKPADVGIATNFDELLTEKGHVQIGANASVGYGYCNIEIFPPIKLATT